MSKSKSDTNAISMLEKDHETVKGLFDKFENADDSEEKQSIISEAIQELKIHATIEEEIFYPTIRSKNEVEEDILNEAQVEHHVARMLIAELDEANEGGEEDEEFRNARFKVLAEAVRHHIKEEEGQMFPQARDLDMDFDSLGQQMMERKEELKSEGVPPDSEHELVSANPGRIRERTTVAGSGRMSAEKSDGQKSESETRKKPGRKKQATR